MSVQKLEIVKKARKDPGKCSKCGRELVIGDSYQYWYPGFRSKHKIVRCLTSECTPRPSERETSKAATILAAQENFEDVVGELEDVGEMEAAVQEVGSAVREVLDEYQEALDAWPAGNEQLQEKVDHYEGLVDEAENWTYDGETEPPRCEEHEDEAIDDISKCGVCEQHRDEWLEEVREAAQEAVNTIDVA